MPAVFSCFYGTNSRDFDVLLKSLLKRSVRNHSACDLEIM